MKYKVWAHKEKVVRGYFEVEAASRQEAEEKAEGGLDDKDFTSVEEEDWVSYGKIEEIDEIDLDR